jgi:tryptophan synthase alpha chain
MGEGKLKIALEGITMNRITKLFSETKQKKQLITYITAGDPATEITLELMHQLVTAGTDVLELGMPFSEPVGEGPVIQKAHERALKAGMNLTKLFSLVQQFRVTNTTTPIVLMGYVNPVENMGYDNFVSECKNSGVDGVLIIDLPFEEGDSFFKHLQQQDIHPIFLVTPTTTISRLEKINQHASGFLYYVSLQGVTGSSALNIASVSDKLQVIYEHTNLPIAVGFGIRDAKSAKAIAEVADAVVVGSAIVSMIEENLDKNKIGEFVSEIKTVL